METVRRPPAATPRRRPVWVRTRVQQLRFASWREWWADGDYYGLVSIHLEWGDWRVRKGYVT